MMTAEELRAFIEGATLNAFDARTGERAAVIRYDPDGRAHATFVDGTEEEGLWGIEAATYWTRYERFRGGGTNAFRLQEIAPGIAQAWFVDGRRAFIQTALEELPDGLLAGD